MENRLGHMQLMSGIKGDASTNFFRWATCFVKLPVAAHRSTKVKFCPKLPLSP